VSPNHLNGILNQPLFNNPNICSNGNTLFFQSFVTAGIVKVADLVYEVKPGFLSQNIICLMIEEHLPQISKHNTQTLWKTILTSLPEHWVKIINETQATGRSKSDLILINDENAYTANNFTVKFTYEILRSHFFKLPTSYSFWSEYAGELNWKDIWKIVFSNEKSGEQTDFDFKVCHNIIFTMEKLYNIGKVVSPICPVCKLEIENLPHLFLFCDENQQLVNMMKDVFTYFERDNGFSQEQLAKWLLFGYIDNDSSVYKFFINILLSVYRLSIYKRRCLLIDTNANINIVILFKTMLKTHIGQLRRYYRKIGNEIEFMNRYVYSIPFVYIEKCNNTVSFKKPLD